MEGEKWAVTLCREEWEKGKNGSRVRSFSTLDKAARRGRRGEEEPFTCIKLVGDTGDSLQSYVGKRVGTTRRVISTGCCVCMCVCICLVVVYSA